MRGWETKKLGEVSQLIARGVAPKYLEIGGLCVLNQKCIRDHEIDFKLARRHDLKVKPVSKDRLIRIGDVLVNSTGTGTLGRVAQLRIQPKEPTTVDTHVTIVRPSSGKFFTEFFGYMLIKIEDEISRSGEGTSGQTELARSTLAKKLSVSYPTSLPEQRRIVAILDEAFAGLEAMRVNAEKNLQNARDLFESYHQSVLTHRAGWKQKTFEEVAAADCSLSYGIVQPGNDVSGGLPIVRPTDLTVKEIRLDGLKRIDPKLAEAYTRTTLKGGELLLCVRGSTGVVSIAAPELEGANVTRGIVPIRFDARKVRSDFGYYLLSSRDVQSQIREKTYGTALMQINIRDLRNITLSFPPLREQQAIAGDLDGLSSETQNLESLYRQKLAAIAELKQSILQKAFSGELASRTVAQAVVSGLSSQSIWDMNERTALVMALAFEQHKRLRRDKTFGHVKAQKILHIVEAEADFDLGRVPIKDAAGPNDFPHMLAAEEWAESRTYFRFPRKATGGYQFIPMTNYNHLLSVAAELEPAQREKITRIIDLFVPMDMQEAELFATVYTAWNNFLIDGKLPTDEEIVSAAREEWHEKKKEIPRHKFFETLRRLKESDWKPAGRGKKVVDFPQGSLFA